MVMFILLALTLAITGCSGNGNIGNNGSETNSNGSNSAVNATADVGATDGPSEKKHLKLWFYWEGKDRFDKVKELTDGFTAQNPNIEIEPVYVPFADFKKRLSIGLAASELPDLVIIDNPDHAAYSAMGLFADITEEVNKWPDKDQFFEGPWKSAQYDGKQYGVPLGSNNLALFYNKELLSDAGVTPPQTWDELRDVAKKLTKDGVTGIGISAPSNEEGTFQFLPWLLSAGADYDTVGSAEGTKAFSILAELVKDGSMSMEVINWTQSDVMKQFAGGKIAMMVNGPWQLPELETVAPDLEFGLSYVPKDSEFASALGGENLGVVNGENVAESVAFLEYVTSPEVIKPFLQSFGYFPTRKDIAADPYWTDNEELKVFADNMNYAMPRGPHPKWPEISNAISEALGKVLTLNSTPEEATSAAQAKIDSILGQ